MSQVSPDFRPAFSRYPFFYVCLYFFLGIICAAKFYSNSDFALLIVCQSLILSSILFTSSKRQSLAKHLLLFVLFSCLGFVATREQIRQTAWESWPFHKGKTTFVMQITELQHGSPWMKGIGEIHWRKQNQPCITPVRFYMKSNRKPRLDEWIYVRTTVIPIVNKGNPGEFDMKQYWETKGIKGQFFVNEHEFRHLKYSQASFLNSMIRSSQQKCMEILSAHLSGKELAIAQALILGDKSMLDQEIRSAFTATGAMHILAVSGLHIGLILQLLLYIIKIGARWVKRSNALLLVIFLLWFYALMTGFSPSVIRAVFMFSVLTWAQWKGWQSSSINTLFFTAFVIVLWKPLYFFDIGFQLSYLAMIGIFLFYQKISKLWLPKNKVLAYLWEGTAIGFAAQIATTPLTLYYFHQFPNYFAIANLGLMGLSTIVLGAGIFILGLHYVPFVGAINALILYLSLYWMFEFIQWIESWPGALVYGFELEQSFIPILFILACVLVLGEVKRTYWKIGAFLFLLILSWINFERYRNSMESHICILNENKLTILLKSKDKTWCFFDDERKDKIAFNVSNYLKVHPADIRYVSIRKKEISLKLGQHLFQIKQGKGQRIICWDKHSWKVLFKEIPVHKTDAHSFFMPWVNHPLSLNHGAKIIPIAMN
jgi:competence protein ComEC